MSGLPTRLAGPAALLAVDDIDTDVILPQTHMVTTTRAGLGAGLFANWRREAAAAGRTFFLDDPRCPEPKILVAGGNYGCGSSREHAVWAHLEAGLGAVVAPSFAPIFEENALQNGLLPVRLEASDWRRLVIWLTGRPGATLRLSLPAATLSARRGPAWPLQLPPMLLRRIRSRRSDLDEILRRTPAIQAREERERRLRPWIFAAAEAVGGADAG